MDRQLSERSGRKYSTSQRHGIRPPNLSLASGSLPFSHRDAGSTPKGGLRLREVPPLLAIRMERGVFWPFAVHNPLSFCRPNRNPERYAFYFFWFFSFRCWVCILFSCSRLSEVNTVIANSFIILKIRIFLLHRSEKTNPLVFVISSISIVHYHHAQPPWKATPRGRAPGNGDSVWIGTAPFDPTAVVGAWYEEVGPEDSKPSGAKIKLIQR